ncbi:MAG TPA: hypothetical protein VE178_20230 [Silvibacterium sp.]|nr:hypothetical protein [Silvibacterium sp.]
MLTESQIEDVWKRQLGAETRALYFADLANRYTAQKKWITALSFFLSSGAAATGLAKMPGWVPILLSVATAAMTAYATAFGLDSRTRSMADLHWRTNQLASDYERLWNNVYSEDASNILESLIQRDAEISKAAVTEAPNDQKRMGRWQDYVFVQHGLSV